MTGNPVVIKMLVNFYRHAGGDGALRHILAPALQDVLQDSSVSIKTDPVEVYKTWINQSESRTGLKRSDVWARLSVCLVCIRLSRFLPVSLSLLPVSQLSALRRLSRGGSVSPRGSETRGHRHHQPEEYDRESFQSHHLQPQQTAVSPVCLSSLLLTCLSFFWSLTCSCLVFRVPVLTCPLTESLLRRYGLRYTAKVLRDTLKAKFPRAREDELYKVRAVMSLPELLNSGRSSNSLFFQRL